MLRILGSYNLLMLRGILRRIYKAVDGSISDEQNVAFMREGIKRKRVLKSYGE